MRNALGSIYLAEESTNQKNGERKKAKLSHPDAFIDEVESNPYQDPDSLLHTFRPQLEQELSQLDVDFQGLTLNIESLDLSGNPDEDVPLSLKERWERFKKRLRQKMIELIMKFGHMVKDMALWLAFEAPKKILKFLKWVGLKLDQLAKVISSWSLKRKLSFLGSFLSLVGLASFYIYVLKNRILYQDQYQFYGSMAELAPTSFDFDPEGVLEPFYDSPRVKAFYFQMKPVVVNLKREGDFNENPMGFFEFAIQGSSGEVLVELKGREPEIIDLVERVIEDHTYEDLDTADGKEELKKDILQELNKKLLEGIVRRVELRNFFIKP